MANKMNPEVHPLQHLSGNNNPQNIDIAQSTLLTVKMYAHDSIRFRAVDKSVSMQHLSFTRQGSDLHVFLDNGHQAAIIEDYFNNPVNIYALDEQDMPHLYLANGTDVYDLAHLADGESTTQTLSPVPTSDDSVTDFSAEDSIMLGGEDDDDDRDGFFAGLISDGALAIAGGIAAAGLAGVAIASANNKGKGDSHENKHQADTTPPAAIHADDIRVTDDAGNRINAGGMTADSTPTVSGRVDAAEAGGKVIIRDNGIAIGEATIGKDGSWSMTVSPALKDGTHNLSAVVVDKAGNHSLPSENIDIGVDTIAPNQASDIVLTDDHGKVIGEVTNDKTPTVSGKGEADATVVLKDGDRVLGSTTVDKDGNWTITSGALADGDHALSVEQSDKAGNTSVVHLPTLNIDTEIAPIGDITLTDKNGNTLVDGATNTGTPDISGKGEAGSTVTITDEKGSEVGSTTVDKDGNWTIKPEKPLGEGNHDLIVDVTDPAGNHTSASLPVSIDSIAPNPAENIIITDDRGEVIVTLTNDSTPTVSGEGEPGATVILKDDAGNILGSAIVKENGSWVITPDDAHALADGDHALSVELSDKSGNTSTVTLQPIAIDTQAPDRATDIKVTDDANEEISDLTKDNTPTVSGKGEPHAIVTLKDSDGSTLGSTIVGADGNWVITTDDTHALTDGDHALKVELRDEAGNASEVALDVITVVTRVPEAVDNIVITDDSGEAIEGITNDTTPTVSGTGQPGTIVELKDVDNNVLGSATTDINGNWRIELDKELTDGKHALTVVQTDKAGNTSAAASLSEIEIDTTAPVAVKDITITDDNNDAIGEATNDTTPTISGEGEPGATVKLLDSKGTELGSATVGADGRWIITPKSELTDGKHALTVVQTDKAGNTSAAASVPEFEIDTKAPTAVEAVVVTGDDNLPIVNITNDSTPTISGEGEPGAIVDLLDSKGTTLGSATVDADGSWSITPETALTDGKYSLSVVQTDKAGNTSAAAAVPEIEVDTKAPDAVKGITIMDDNNDAIGETTNDTTPTVSGTGEPGATVTLKDDKDTTLGTTTVNADGSWSITPEALKDGEYKLQVVQTDKAGNTSAVASLQPITIDTLPPDAVKGVVIRDDAGNEIKDFTNDSTPTVSGKGMAGATIELKDDKDNLLGTTTVGADGKWSITPDALSDADYHLKVVQTSKAGNSSSFDVPGFTIDTAAPTAVEAIVVTGDDNLPIGSITNDTMPTVSGEGEPGATVDLLDSKGTTLGSATVGADGSWSITPETALTDGKYSLSVVQTDKAGNTSTPAAVPEIEIDTQAPPQAENIMLTDKNGDAVTGTNTNTKTPVISGEAEPESTVTITDKAGTVIGSATADKDGHWSITPENALAENDQTLTVTVKDAAGNTTSSSLAVNVDSVAPDAPDNVTAINDRSGEDVTVVDGLTNDNTVALTGHAEKNSLITIRDGETVLGTATADDEGNWRFELPEEKKLKDGDHTLIVTSTDGFNNVSDETSLPLRVDTTNNNVTTLNTLDGSNSTITDIPRVNGIVDLKDGDSPESVKVLIFDDVDGDGIYDKNVDKLLATVDNIGADGSWNAQLKSMTEGEHHIKAVVVDAAGNYSSVSSLNGSSDGSLDVNAPERTTLWGYDEGNPGGQGRGGVHFATTVKNIGHFSSDDADDIAISAPFSSHGNFNDSGMVYVLFGKNNNLLSQYHDIKQLLDAHPEAGLKIYNSGTGKNSNNTAVGNDRMGLIIEKVDLNGDGINELVISSLWADKTYVIWGDKIDGIHEIDLAAIDKGDNSLGFSISSPIDSWQGYSIAGYDYNGDGVQDLFISDIHGPKDQFGGVLVIKGSKDPNHNWENIKLEIVDNSENTPGGGYQPPVSSDTESDYIYHEKTETGNQNWNLGADMRNVGDINGDGYDDFVILDTRAYVNDASGKGEAYLIYGQKEGFSGSIRLDDLSSEQMVRIQNNGTGWLGEDNPNAVLQGDAGWETEPNQKVIAGLGDFYGDSDKSGDLAIAAPQDQYGNHQGKVWIVKGSSAGIGSEGKLQIGTSENAHLSTEDGFGIVSSSSSGDRSFGSRIVGGYDINGDGIPDLIISDPLAVHDGKTVGAVYVVYGGKTGEYQLDANGEISIDSLVSNGLAEVHWGEVPNGRFGSDVDVADMNGDGRLDLIVGANGEDGASNPANPGDLNGNCGSITIIYNHHDVVESKAAAIGRMSLEPESHNATDAGILILDGDHQNVDLASLTQALKTLHHVDLADGENTLTVSSDEVKTLSEGQDASAPALTIEGENGNVALTGGQENWQEGGKVEVNGTVYQAWESSSHSQILVDDRIHVTVL